MWVFLLLLLFRIFFFFSFVQLLHTQPSSLSHCIVREWIWLREYLNSIEGGNKTNWKGCNHFSMCGEKACHDFKLFKCFFFFVLFLFFCFLFYLFFLFYFFVLFYNSYAHFSVLNYKYNVRNITKYHNNFKLLYQKN